VLAANPARQSGAVEEPPSGQACYSAGFNARERMTEMPTYLTTPQAAAMTGLDQDTLREMCRQGLLPGAIRGSNAAWKIPLESINSWLEAQAVPAGAAGSNSSSGDHIHISETHHSNIAAGRNASVIVNRTEQNIELARQFERIQESIAARPEDPDLDKKELSATVAQIEQEVGKGETANPNKVERWLKFLAMMAPDVLEVVLAALTGPIPGITAAIRKIAEKARAEAGGQA
jgi:hypothetical protein